MFNESVKLNFQTFWILHDDLNELKPSIDEFLLSLKSSILSANKLNKLLEFG